MAKFINVYLEDRAYGGPEEGGWYFNCGEIVRSIPVPLMEVERVKDRVQRRVDEENEGTPDISSVLSQGRYAVYVQNKPGSSYPETRPHYE